MLVVLTVGVSCADRHTPGVAQSEPVDIPAGLEEFYNQSLQWSPCSSSDPDLGMSPDIECALVRIPTDYSNPAGGTSEMAVTRRPASGDRIGALLTNPGGPGYPGRFLADVPVPDEIADRFDIVGVDPRGVGGSTPQVRCRTDEEIDADRAELLVDMSPAGIAEAEDKSRIFAKQCADRNGTDVLAGLGTDNVARDYDVLRAALGDRQLTFLGYSYGTRLGATYAYLFPRNVRAMVLDGAVDLEQDPSDAVVDQYAGFQGAFNEFAADCATEEFCPLGSDPGMAVERFRALVNPLMDAPVPAHDGRVLGYSDAIDGVIQALYSAGLWRSLQDALTGLAAGQGDRLLALADNYWLRSPDGTYSNAQDAFTAVLCVDDPPVTDPAVAGETDTRIRQVAPFIDTGRGTGAAPLDTCAFWPVPAGGPPTGDRPAELGPTLVVSTTGDPATPYEAGVALAEQLDAGLITYQADQHTVVFEGDSCVDDAVSEYLIAPSAVADLTC